jgi:hypothetical protein
LDKRYTPDIGAATGSPKNATIRIWERDYRIKLQESMYKNLQNLGLKLSVWKFVGLARLQCKWAYMSVLVAEVSEYKKERVNLYN